MNPETRAEIIAVDKKGKIVIGLTLMLTIVLVGVSVVFILPASVSARNNSDQVRIGNELASCRSSFRALVDEALIDVTVADTELDLLTNEALSAIQVGDHDRLSQIMQQAPALREAVGDAVVDARAANEQYKAAVALSREDPERFIDECRAVGA